MRSLGIAAATLALAACGSEPPRQQAAESNAVTPEPSGPPVVQQADRKQGGQAERR